MRSPDPTDESPHDSGAPSPQVKGRSGEALIGIVATCRFAEAVAIGMLVPILPLFLVNLDPEAHGLLDAWIGTASFSHEEQTAILFSAAGFAMAAIQIASGRISDAFDMRKPLILFGLGGGTLCAASLLILDSFGELLLARVLLGIFMGLTFPPLMAIIAHHSPEGRGGRTLGIYSSIRLLGFAGGPLLGAWISENWGYTTAFATSSFLLATSVLTVGLWVPEHKDGRKRGPGEPKHVLPPVPFTQRLLGSGIFLMMVGISAMISLFPTYQREYGASDQELGLVFSVFIGARFLLQYPLGYLGDHRDKKWVLIIAMLLLVPSVALQGFIRSMDDLLVLRILLGAAAAAMSVSINGIAAERSEPGNRARVMGVNTFSFSLGVACGPLLTGFIADPRWAFAIPAVLTCVLVALVAWFVPSDRAFRERKPAPRDPEEPLEAIIGA